MNRLLTTGRTLLADQKEIEASAVDILRRADRGEHIPLEEWEVAIKATEDELEVVFRDPTQWSFVERSHRNLAGNGKAMTCRECEKWAIRLAEEHVDEHSWVIRKTGTPPFDFEWNWKLLGKWRFILWPPHGNAERLTDYARDRPTACSDSDDCSS